MDTTPTDFDGAWKLRSVLSKQAIGLGLGGEERLPHRFYTT
jgi:hypothetical protein